MLDSFLETEVKSVPGSQNPKCHQNLYDKFKNEQTGF